jgi:mono/diheme cytochrome c family protein
MFEGVMLQSSRSLIYGGLLAILTALTACRSEDLGKSDPDVVDVSGPTWGQGIDQLVNQKCANCHTARRGEFVPSNTPNTIDSIGSKDFWLTARNLSRIILIRTRFTSGDNPMPPRYGTPFSDNERTQFTAFLTERVTSLTNGTGGTNTSTCTAVPDWNDQIAATVASHCATAGCHATAATGVPALATKEDWLTNRETARALIRASSMPKDDPGFAATDAGKLLLGTLGCP